jgi:hypothetical protein
MARAERQRDDRKHSEAKGEVRPPSDAEAVTLGLPPVQLYDMSQDDRETTNVQDQHPEVVERLTALLDRYVADGRSTPGAAQKNDVAVDIRKDGAKARSQ